MAKMFSWTLHLLAATLLLSESRPSSFPQEVDMISKQLIRSLALVFALSSAVYAQKPAASPLTEEQRKAQQELEHKALVLLDDVVKEGDSFKQAENRIQ